MHASYRRITSQNSIVTSDRGLASTGRVEAIICPCSGQFRGVDVGVVPAWPRLRHMPRNLDCRHPVPPESSFIILHKDDHDHYKDYTQEVHEENGTMRDSQEEKDAKIKSTDKAERPHLFQGFLLTKRICAGAQFSRGEWVKMEPSE